MPGDGASTHLDVVPRQVVDHPIVMRTERDMLGEREVPDCVLYGIHTLRAIENFNTGHPPVGHFPTFVQALGAVKAASALSNLEFGALNAGIVDPVVAACEELERGNWLDHFPVEIVQGGAGTSTNMNANEVIANRALDILGAARGDYERISPLEHVNKSQSTNDVYPTALRVALVREVDTLEEALEHLAVAFDGRAAQAEGVIKLGRTQLQDAVPIRFTRELAAHASTLRQERRQLQRAREGLTVINLGGTAVGNSVAAPHGYPQLAGEHLAARTGVAVETAPDLVQATIDTAPLLNLSSVLRSLAVVLTRIASDMRLQNSGPTGGLSELCLPPLQAGSSIMPDKVNPVIPELVNQICFQVVGHDATVSWACASGQFQLNAFQPVIAHALFRSLQILTSACDSLANQCVTQMSINADHVTEVVERSLARATLLVPVIGYHAAFELATSARSTGARIEDVLQANRHGYSDETVAAALEALSASEPM